MGLHLVGLAGGGIVLKRTRLKEKKVFYPIRLVEMAESSPRPVVSPPVQKEKPKPLPPKPPEPVVKKPEPKKPPEPKKGIPLKKAEKKEEKKPAPQKKPVEEERPDQKENEKKVSDAIEEIKKALAARQEPKVAEVSPRFIERQLQLYAADIDRRIKENWSIPKTFSNDMGDLDAIVVIRLKPNGELSDVRLEKRSGFHPFDESTLRAIKKAAPFPPPPVGVKEQELEFEIRFYSDQMG
ncbi:MAG: energy transducer TonB [bacterium]